MATYKITNITNLAGKRDAKFNMALDIEYIDNRAKKIIHLKPGEDVFLTVNSLPLSVHRLRIKKLIEINEISAVELAKSMEKSKSQTKVKSKSPKRVISVVKKETPVTTSKKTMTTSKKKTARE